MGTQECQLSQLSLWDEMLEVALREGSAPEAMALITPEIVGQVYGKEFVQDVVMRKWGGSRSSPEFFSVVRCAIDACAQTINCPWYLFSLAVFFISQGVPNFVEYLLEKYTSRTLQSRSLFKYVILYWASLPAISRYEIVNLVLYYLPPQALTAPVKDSVYPLHYAIMVLQDLRLAHILLKANPQAASLEAYTRKRIGPSHAPGRPVVIIRNALHHLLDHPWPPEGSEREIYLDMVWIMLQEDPLIAHQENEQGEVALEKIILLGHPPLLKLALCPPE